MPNKLRLYLVGLLTMCCMAAAIATPYYTLDQIVYSWGQGGFSVNLTGTPPTVNPHLTAEQIFNLWAQSGFAVTASGGGGGGSTNATDLSSGLTSLSVGGTAANLTGAGIAHGYLALGSGGTAVSVAQPAFSDLSGVATSGQIPDLSGTYSLKAGNASLTTVGTLSAGSIPYSLLTGTPTIPTANPSLSNLSVGTVAVELPLGAHNITTTGNLSIGTVTTGTWSGTAIAASKGGTAIDSSASTGIAHVSAGTWSVSTLSAGDLATGTNSSTNFLRGDRSWASVDFGNLTGTATNTQLASSPSNTTFLRGDMTWATPSGGAGGNVSLSNITSGTLPTTLALGTSHPITSAGSAGIQLEPGGTEAARVDSSGLNLTTNSNAITFGTAGALTSSALNQIVGASTGLNIASAAGTTMKLCIGDASNMYMTLGSSLITCIAPLSIGTNPLQLTFGGSSAGSSIYNIFAGGNGLTANSPSAFVLTRSGTQILQVGVIDQIGTTATLFPVNVYANSSSTDIFTVTGHHGFLHCEGNTGSYGTLRVDGTTISIVSSMSSGYSVTGSPASGAYGFSLGGSTLNLVLGSAAADSISIHFEGT